MLRGVVVTQLHMHMYLHALSMSVSMSMSMSLPMLLQCLAHCFQAEHVFFVHVHVTVTVTVIVYSLLCARFYLLLVACCLSIHAIAAIADVFIAYVSPMSCVGGCCIAVLCCLVLCCAVCVASAMLLVWDKWCCISPTASITLLLLALSLFCARWISAEPTSLTRCQPHWSEIPDLQLRAISQRSANSSISLIWICHSSIRNCLPISQAFPSAWDN